MNEEEFLERMEIADAELASEGVPIYARFFRAFNKLVPGYEGELVGHDIDPEVYPPFEGPNLLKHISEWYNNRYGERSYVPADRGKVPIVLRREVYLIRIPLAFGLPAIAVLPLVEGLTEEMAHSLNENELVAIKEAFESGFALTYEIEDLRTSLGPEGSLSLPDTTNNMIRSAIEDRDTALRCLSAQLDPNGACFHAQQHAEKMLKSYLLVRGICTEAELGRRPYGHNLTNILSRCANSSGTFYNLTGDIGMLSNITMGIRYTTPEVDSEIAVETVWAALRVGGLCACEILGQERRYRA